MNMQVVEFNHQNIELISKNNQLYMSGAQIGRVIELSQNDGVAKIYGRHKSEFTDEMTITIRQGRSTVRLFNREGAWLIGMFARTPKAAEFRKWVLKVLGAVVDGQQVDKPVTVSEHTRALPSGKKEIVLSAKVREEIGGIVKKCTAVAVREEIDHSVNNALERLFNPNPVENRNLFQFCSILQSVLNDSLDDILCTADKKDLENRRLKKALQKANSQLQQIKESAQPIVIE